MDLSFLPSVNASLNGLAGCFLVAGYVLVKNGRIEAHKRCMFTATGVSVIFLISYVTHQAWRGGEHTAFRGTGVLRYLYYLMLITHVLLAMAVPVFAMRLIWLGVKGSIAKHKRLAKIAFPIWLYVSVTGVLIYFALYWYNPQV